jgi:lipid A 3-O-deacylase
MNLKALCGAVLGLAATAGSANATDFAIGVMAHNIQVVDDKNAGKEASPNIEAQLTFDAIGPAWSGRPHPFLIGSLNTGGDFSFAGVGLEWRWRIGDTWRIDPSLGYVVHTGETDNPFAPGTPQSVQFADDHVLYGSEDLFRLTVAVSRALGPRTDAQVAFTHLSHGHIIGSGRNQGVDQLGVRLGYRFGG